ncbi:MAG: peptide chain release factor-like protein [Candidatus Omnitrophota bacterium]
MFSFNVTQRKQKELIGRMNKLGVSEDDFQEKFIRSKGPGGQKVNKTSSCVFLRHISTGITVKCQKERLQSINRFLARRMLLDKIEKAKIGFIAEEKKRIEKIRRQKRKRSKRAKEKILAAKRRQSEKKKLRSSVNESTD